MPAVVVISDQFLSTANTIARMQGMPDYPLAIVKHPIGSLSSAELQGRAESIVSDVRDLLVEKVPTG